MATDDCVVRKKKTDVQYVIKIFLKTQKEWHNDNKPLWFTLSEQQWMAKIYTAK
jgi:hypothetical protein